MSQLTEISEKLLERAAAYEAPYGGSPDWVHSGSYPIATALREVAYVLRALQDNEKGERSE